MRATIVRWIRTGSLTALAFCATLLLALPPAFSAEDSDSLLVSASSITYTTRRGDTLSSIATRFTNATGNWNVLGKLNNISKDTSIPVGTPILIPASLLIDEPSQAQVLAVSGNVSAMGADNRPVALKIGSVITEGMQLDTATNSFLTIGLSDASKLSIPSGSRVRMAKLRMARYTRSPRTEIAILRGSIESQVTPLTPNMGRFEIRSPLAMAGVRGTHFRVRILPNGTTGNELLSGTVEVERHVPGDGILLQKGQGNVVTAVAVGAPVGLLAAPQLADQAYLQPAAMANFSVTPLAGAAGYHLQIGTDAEGLNLLAETRSASTNIPINGIREGNYFVRVSAIDRLGLEGYARMVPVNLSLRQSEARIAAPSPPVIESSDSKQFQLTWRSPSPAAGFRIQVGRDADFSWLQFNATTVKPELTLPRPPFGTYFARVQIQNADGSTGPFSATQGFVVTDQWIIHEGNPIAAQLGRTR
ncbi:FecR domain-containing protein [Actimicrobium antarcticum]|uniref:LysM domain-containing protein n=1 Tax=Actimicrobium antarcticum TaxID=1051899 RepID=A0ABP7TVE1_9BURK